MELSASLLAKAGGGAGMLGVGATGIYFASTGGGVTSSNLSKYETALINFLQGGEDRDIIFDVKKDGKTDLTASDISFSEGKDKETITVSAKVQLSTTNNTYTSFKKGNAAVGDNDEAIMMRR